MTKLTDLHLGDRVRIHYKGELAIFSVHHDCCGHVLCIGSPFPLSVVVEMSCNELIVVNSSEIEKA